MSARVPVPWRERRHTTKNLVIAVALAAAGALVLVRRVVPLLADRASYTDGERVYASTGGAAIRYAVWDAPERLGGGINGLERESRPALSPDGRWMVFAVGDEGLNAELYLAEVVRGEPVEPRPIASLNTPSDELAPAFGERALYFASNRAGGAGGYDLYAAPWEGAGFGPAQPVAEGVNTPADELDPAPNAALGADGEEALAFASDRAGGGREGFDLFLALSEGAAGPAGARRVVALEALNSSADEREPAFTADGRTLFFASDRAPSRGGFDLYRSLLEGAAWLPPLAVPGLDGAASERGPAPSPDGFALYFELAPDAAPERATEHATEFGSVTPDGDLAHERGDLFRARSRELFRRPPPPLGWYDLALFAALLLLALLAWLAKRWQALDILYKCFLVSLLIHLLLLWWFQRLHPESGVPDGGPSREPTFRVRMLTDPSAAAAQRERGGALEVARASAPDAASPERLLTDLLDPAQERAAPAPARGLERAPADPGRSPERTQETVERTLAPDATRAPELAQPARELELLSAAAPDMGVALRSQAGEARTAREGTQVRTPERASLPTSASSPAEAGAAPVVITRRASESERARSEFAPAAGASPSRPATSEAPGVELAGPAEAFERRGSEASEGERDSELPGALAFAPERARSPSFSERGPERADVQAGGAHATAVVEAPRSFSRRESEAAESEPGGAREPAPPFAPGADGPVRRGLADVPGVTLDSPREEFVASGADEAASAPAGEGAKNGGLPAALAFVPERGRSTADPASGPARASLAGASSPRGPAPGAIEAEAPPSRALAVDTAERGRALPDAPARLLDTPYRSRFGTEKEIALESHGGGADTERAVALGLEYLARVQRREGHWGDAEDFHTKYRHVLIGKTGLALLAFLGAGHTQHSGTRFSGNVARAIDFLLAVQEEATGHFGNSEAYSHGIATYALAEDFALTRDERLREPLERAAAHILAHQIDRGEAKLDGGWSYFYPDGATFDRWPRVSITAWQVMALESARLGGLAVPDAAFEAARGFLLLSWDPRLSAFRYSHDPERLGSAYATLPGSTPAGLFALSLLGEDVASERFEPAREFVLRRTPDGFRFDSEDEFVRSASGNLYFWYYGSLALFRVGGDAWERWNAGLKETLLPSQARDGSWRPIDVYAQYAGDGDDERSYTTAMCVLTLEVYYRYFTPLLQVR